MECPALLILTVLVAGYFGTIDAKVKDPAIVGPSTERVCPHQFPFYAVLKWKGYLNCGGSLIRKDVVLTAAQCIDDDNLNVADWTVELGRHSLYKDEDNSVQVMKIDRIEIHPFFKRETFKNDVALIFLTEKATINEYVQTIDSLAVFGQNEEIKESTRCYVTGYGFTDYDGDAELPEYPFKYNADIGKYQQCREVIKEEVPFRININPRREVCVFKEDSSSVCYGDGGGPLFCDLNGDGKYVQHGIVSWLPYCGNGVTVFPRVSYFNKWIKYKIAAYRREKM